MTKTNQRGCIFLLVLLALLAGIYFYLVRETGESGPSPSQGTLPPQREPTASPSGPLQPNPPR